MAIPPALLEQARMMLAGAQRPVFFHDDDCDGACSYAVLASACNDPKSVPVKNSPVVLPEYLRKIAELQPDLVIILDKPQVSEEFLQGVTCPVLWVDHHEPQHPHGKVVYLNPRAHDPADNRPTSYWAYKIVKERLWVATVGTVADWFIPDFIGEAAQAYPTLIPHADATFAQLYLDSPLGTLIRVLQFNLKGTITDVRKSIHTLTRIEHPDEILHQTSSRGRYLWRKYERLASAYDQMLTQAKACSREPGKLLLYLYENDQSFTAELSNELLLRYPAKVTLIARRNGGKMKCSVRSNGVELPTKVKRALEGLNGYGGGHTNACGIVVAQEDWPAFLQKFSALLEDG